MSEALIERVQATVRDVPDFPIEGILFKDITPVVQDGALLAEITRYFADRCRSREVERVVGIESRGFIFGAALAHELGVGLTLIRKPGKLPAEKIGVDYELEYGSDRVEMHVDGVTQGQRVVLIDDLLATGGTAAAAADLLDQAGAEIVECLFLIELGFLPGRGRLGREAHALITY